MNENSVLVAAFEVSFSSVLSVVRSDGSVENETHVDGSGSVRQHRLPRAKISVCSWRDGSGRGRGRALGQGIQMTHVGHVTRQAATRNHVIAEFKEKTAWTRRHGSSCNRGGGIGGMNLQTGSTLAASQGAGCSWRELIEAWLAMRRGWTSVFVNHIPVVVVRMTECGR